jgi:hypothetical protein
VSDLKSFAIVGRPWLVHHFRELRSHRAGEIACSTGSLIGLKQQSRFRSCRRHTGEAVSKLVIPSRRKDQEPNAQQRLDFSPAIAVRHCRSAWTVCVILLRQRIKANAGSILREHTDGFIESYNHNAKSFAWTSTESISVAYVSVTCDARY